MNALRKTAVDVFQAQCFGQSPSQYDVLNITGSRGTDLQFVHDSASLGDIERQTQGAHLPGSASGPSLTLIEILYDLPASRQTFHASQADFYKLLEIFQIELYSLDLISNDMTGFHCLGGDPNGTSISYYFQCFAYKFVWTYDRRSQSTKGIVLVNKSARGRKAFGDCVAVMKCNVELISHPLFLVLAGSIETMDFMDKLLRKQYGEVRTVEATTGFHPWQKEFDVRDDMRELAEMSRRMSAVLVEVEMILRRMRQLRLALYAFKRPPPPQNDRECRTSPVPESHNNDSSGNSAGSVAAPDGIAILQSKLEVMEIDFNYVHARVENQLTTIFQLMTRDEALASIDLAKAAMRDSSSMKVIAIMTMAFLPGTFIAALFSVPSLHWDADRVVQDRFWVYWAFTLPLTALVFVLWGFLTKGGAVALLPRPREAAKNGHVHGSGGGTGGAGAGGGKAQIPPVPHTGQAAFDVSGLFKRRGRVVGSSPETMPLEKV